jgi:hypothetical protein
MRPKSGFLNPGLNPERVVGEKKIEEPIEFFILNLKINRMAYFLDLMKVSFREKKIV